MRRWTWGGGDSLRVCARPHTTVWRRLREPLRRSPESNRRRGSSDRHDADNAIGASACRQQRLPGGDGDRDDARRSSCRRPQPAANRIALGSTRCWAAGRRPEPVAGKRRAGAARSGRRAHRVDDVRRPAGVAAAHPRGRWQKRRTRRQRRPPGHHRRPGDRLPAARTRDLPRAARTRAAHRAAARRRAGAGVPIHREGAAQTGAPAPRRRLPPRPPVARSRGDPATGRWSPARCRPATAGPRRTSRAAPRRPVTRPPTRCRATSSRPRTGADLISCSLRRAGAAPASHTAGETGPAAAPAGRIRSAPARACRSPSGY